MHFYATVFRGTRMWAPASFHSWKVLWISTFLSFSSRFFIYLFPEYEGAAQALKELNIPLFKVDGTREKELADQYQVAGWPEIKMFRKGRLYTYKGPREQVCSLILLFSFCFFVDENTVKSNFDTVSIKTTLVLIN